MFVVEAHSWGQFDRENFCLFLFFDRQPILADVKGEIVDRYSSLPPDDVKLFDNQGREIKEDRVPTPLQQPVFYSPCNGNFIINFVDLETQFEFDLLCPPSIKVCQIWHFLAVS
jgi:hypothetical protein